MDRGGQSPVPLGAIGFQLRFVGHRADQRVAEGVLGGRGEPHLIDQLRVQQLVEHRIDAQRGKQLGPEAGSDHRRRVQRTLGRGAHPVDTRFDSRLHRGRHAHLGDIRPTDILTVFAGQHPALHQLAHHLLGEKRIADVIMASDADLAVQDELLDACASHYPIIDRVDRVVQMAVGIGNSLGGAAPWLTRHPTLSAAVTCTWGTADRELGSWGVPEGSKVVRCRLTLSDRPPSSGTSPNARREPATRSRLRSLLTRVGGYPLVARICCVSRHADQVETSGFSASPTLVMTPGV